MMSFTTLIGTKTVAGSIQSFVRYAKVPVEVVLEEAQALIYSRLRVREMRSSAFLTLAREAWTIALPTGFLEPISMRDREGWQVIPNCYESQDQILGRRLFHTDRMTTLGGSLSAGATSMSVASAANFPTTVPYTVRIDDEAVLVTGGAGTTTWTITRGYGGTTAAAHSSGAVVDGGLESGVPMHVAVFDELFQFECKADAVRYFDLAFYKTPALLSPSNQTNFLTRRWPHILRIGCLAGAASFMKDDEEETKQLAKLTALCEAACAVDDLGKAT